MILAMAILCASMTNAAVDVAYFDMAGNLTLVKNDHAIDLRTALAALGSPTKDESGDQLVSSVPQGTRLLDIRSYEGTTYVEFSREIVGAGLSEKRLDDIYHQVRSTVRQFNLGEKIRILVEGAAIEGCLFSPVDTRTIHKEHLSMDDMLTGPLQFGALQGYSITLSPGHGLYWTGKEWETQRPVYGAPLNEEDYHNLEMCQYLMGYLESDGMIVKNVRCMDKDLGNHSNGSPWWQMSACYWLRELGYPASVYGTCNALLGGPDSDMSNDIRCRPLASNYDNTDIYVSIHTNGSKGDSYDGPSGTEIYYDGGEDHHQWGGESHRLAADIGNSVMDVIQANYDPTWSSHGELVKNSEGRYGEIRLPERPAVLMELGFHDTCNRDAIYLRDNYFRSASMWGIYKGICDYFGVKPTWDLYSSVLLSDNMPLTMNAGKKYQCSVTLLNRGVVWTEAQKIRLGITTGADAFSVDARQLINGEVDPGDTYTFSFTLTAPSKAGTYHIGWQMLHNDDSWFGASLGRTIRVLSIHKRVSKHGKSHNHARKLHMAR